MENSKKEVFIYGDIWGGWSLDSLRWQLEEANGKDVLVKINSFGGDVDEGFMMYNELRRYASDNKASVTTFAEGNCASIATVPFLAGDERIVNEYMQPFVHNAWTYVEGDSKAMKKAYEMTEQATHKIAKFYSEITNLTYEEARELMDNESFISAEDCVKYNFAHKIESVTPPVNKLVKPINKLKTSDMSKPKTSLLNKLKGMFKTVNLLVYTASEQELDFYELEEGVTPQVGDKAKVNGQPAADAFEDGKVLLPNGEVYVFVGEELTEIIAAAEVEEELTAEEYEEVIEEAANTVNKLQNSLKKFKAENTELKNKLEKYEKVENSFKGENKETPKKGESTANGFGNFLSNKK